MKNIKNQHLVFGVVVYVASANIIVTRGKVVVTKIEEVSKIRKILKIITYFSAFFGRFAIVETSSVIFHFRQFVTELTKNKELLKLLKALPRFIAGVCEDKVKLLIANNQLTETAINFNLVKTFDVLIFYLLHNNQYRLRLLLFVITSGVLSIMAVSSLYPGIRIIILIALIVAGIRIDYDIFDMVTKFANTEKIRQI